MRALKVLVVAMGVLIVLGTVGLVVAVVYKVQHRSAMGAPVPGGIVPGGAPAVASVLDEPAGTRITAIASGGGRLAVQLQGGGPDRLVLLDPATGRVLGRVSLAR